MNFRFARRIRFGLIALGVLSGLSVPVGATPLSAVGQTLPANVASGHAQKLLQVRHRNRCYARYCGQRYYKGKRYQNWAGNNWRPYRYNRYRPRHYVGPGIYFGVPAYRYVQPRRNYGYRLTAAHVNWCYNRYRSYREWDNTFQPYHGPRRQCWSPYS